MFAWALLAAGLVGVPQAVHSQQPPDWDPRRVQVTREYLLDLLDRLEKSARSPAYSDALRQRSRFEASLIRARLELGDFRVGDRILLVVEGEATLADTFTVGPGRVLPLPVIGDVPIGAVLRGELEPRLEDHLSRFMRDPKLRAWSFFRVSIIGGVARPGFYTVPSEALVTDALMLAGGTVRQAKLDKIRIERDGDRIWEGAALQAAIVEGRTLDHLNLRAGDRIVVPERGGGLAGARPALRVVMLLLAIPGSVYALTRVF